MGDRKLILHLVRKPVSHRLENQQSFHELTGSSAGRVSSLHDEVLDDSVELGLVVVPLHAELDEVPACLGAFSGPKLDLDVAHCRFKKDLALSWRFLDVDIAHPGEKKYSVKSLSRLGYGRGSCPPRHSVRYLFHRHHQT